MPWRFPLSKADSGAEAEEVKALTDQFFVTLRAYAASLPPLPDTQPPPAGRKKIKELLEKPPVALYGAGSRASSQQRDHQERQPLFCLGIGFDSHRSRAWTSMRLLMAKSSRCCWCGASLPASRRNSCRTFWLAPSDGHRTSHQQIQATHDLLLRRKNLKSRTSLGKRTPKDAYLWMSPEYGSATWRESVSVVEDRKRYPKTKRPGHSASLLVTKPIVFCSTNRDW